MTKKPTWGEKLNSNQTKTNSNQTKTNSNQTKENTPKFKSQIINESAKPKI